MNPQMAKSINDTLLFIAEFIRDDATLARLKDVRDENAKLTAQRAAIQVEREGNDAALAESRRKAEEASRLQQQAADAKHQTDLAIAAAANADAARKKELGAEAERLKQWESRLSARLAELDERELVIRDREEKIEEREKAASDRKAEADATIARLAAALPKEK